MDGCRCRKHALWPGCPRHATSGPRTLTDPVAARLAELERRIVELERRAVTLVHEFEQQLQDVTVRTRAAVTFPEG